MYGRIRDLLEDSDLTQTQLARLLYCSQQLYSSYERNAINIPTDILIRLAAYHNTSIDYLMGHTDVKDPLPQPRIRRTNKPETGDGHLAVPRFTASIADRE